MFKYNFIITFIVCLIALGCVRYFQTHKSTVVRGELVVDTMIAIKGGYMVRFEETMFCGRTHIQHPYSHQDIHFKVGDTLTIECDTALHTWVTSMTKTYGEVQADIIAQKMKEQLHDETVVVDGYKWSQ